MAKDTQRVNPEQTPEKPKLHPGTIIDRPCLVADASGRVWWVNPDTRQLEQV